MPARTWLETLGSALPLDQPPSGECPQAKRETAGGSGGLAPDCDILRGNVSLPSSAQHVAIPLVAHPPALSPAERLALGTPGRGDHDPHPLVRPVRRLPVRQLPLEPPSTSSSSTGSWLWGRSVRPCRYRLEPPPAGVPQRDAAASSRSMESIFIGLLCHFDQGVEASFRFYYVPLAPRHAFRYSSLRPT